MSAIVSRAAIGTRRAKALFLGALTSGLLIACFGPASAIAAPTDMVDLGQASSYAALSGASVGNTVSAPGAPHTTLRGDLGVKANAQPTGFPPGVVTGATRVGTAADQAHADLVAAYNEVAARPGGAPLAGALAGATVSPGLHTIGGAASNAGTLTLDGGGNPDAVFVFQVNGAMAFAAGSHVLLTNGARASRVFWQVNGAGTVGANADFAGTLMAFDAVGMGNGTVVNGRVFARNGALTLDNNQFYSAPPTLRSTAGRRELYRYDPDDQRHDRSRCTGPRHRDDRWTDPDGDPFGRRMVGDLGDSGGGDVPGRRLGHRRSGQPRELQPDPHRRHCPPHRGRRHRRPRRGLADLVRCSRQRHRPRRRAEAGRVVYRPRQRHGRDRRLWRACHLHAGREFLQRRRFPDSFTYTLNGGSTATVSVRVGCVNDNPVAVDDSNTVNEDSGFTMIEVRRNDTDDNMGQKVVQLVANPANGDANVVNGGNAVQYRPDPNYCNDSPGSSLETFVYTLNGGSNATVSVRVQCMDDQPTAVDDMRAVAEDASFSTFPVRENDTDPDIGLKQVRSVSNPVNGDALISNGGNTLDYRPDANYCNDGGTRDSFTYTLNGGSTATVSVRVDCVNDNPVAVNDDKTVNEDSGFTDDRGPPQRHRRQPGPEPVQSVQNPANGDAEIIGGGTAIRYTPDPDYCNDGRSARRHLHLHPERRLDGHRDRAGELRAGVAADPGFPPDAARSSC